MTTTTERTATEPTTRGERAVSEKARKVPCLRYSRTVGYIRPLALWSDHKRQEFKDRKTYNVGAAVERAKEG